MNRILLWTFWRELERLHSVRDSGHHRRVDGILARQFDCAPTHCGGYVKREHGERILEDVHDRDTAGRHSLLARVFSGAARGALRYISKGEAWRPHVSDSPSESHNCRLRGHR